MVSSLTAAVWPTAGPGPREPDSARFRVGISTAADGGDWSAFESPIISGLSEGVVVQDRAGIIRVCNPAAERILGLRADILTGRASVDPRWRTVHDDGTPWPGETHPSMVTLATGEEINGVTMGVERPDGTRVWLAVSSRPLHSDGIMIGVVATFVDVTERVDLIRALEAAQHQFRRWFKSSPIAMALVSMERTYLDVNDEYCALTGWNRDELVAGGPGLVLQPEERDGRQGMIETLLAEGRDTYRRERRLRHRNGSDLDVMMTATLVRDASGSPIHVFTQFVDLGEARERERRLEHLADHDALTGLPNRRAYDRAILQVGSHDVRSTAVLLIDLDGFKAVNDEFGHRCGDEILTRVAGALRRRLRAGDQVARIGGDEFAVILTDVDAERAIIVAEALIEEIARSSRPDNELATGPTIWASIGIALHDPTNGQSHETALFNAADRALYDAKRNGGNTWRLA